MNRMSPERRAYERGAALNGVLWFCFVFVVPTLIGKVLS